MWTAKQTSEGSNEVCTDPQAVKEVSEWSIGLKCSLKSDGACCKKTECSFGRTVDGKINGFTRKIILQLLFVAEVNITGKRNCDALF